MQQCTVLFEVESHSFAPPPAINIVFQKLEEQFIKSNKQVKEIGILSFEVAGTILIYLFITSYQIYQNFEGEFETKDSARKCERMISN